MQIHRIPFTQVPQLSKRDVAYATQNPALRPFYRYELTEAAFADIIQQRSAFPTNRETLVEVLQAQYAQLGAHAADGDAQVKLQLAHLGKENTFTVTTAHQPSLFTGPLYFVIKILSTINLTRRLAKAYPAYNFVPVFVTGGEDHDFEEVNHLHLFGKTIEWQNQESGAVGMMSTATLTSAFETLSELLGQSESAQQIFTQLQEAYSRHETYGLATVDYVHQLFGQFGLVVLDMNQVAFKRLFAPIMRKELLEQASQPLVTAAQAELESTGFGAQAHARDINLFYLRDGLRERIELTDGVYKVLNTDYQFTKDELLAELDAHPEYFSPNVVMRPLFQELILPNLAYIGGGGEIAYWLERLTQFEAFGLPFPMLIRRSSLLWLDRGTTKRMRKLGLSVNDLFTDTDSLIRQMVTEATDSELTISAEKAQLEALFQSIADKAKAIDPTLAKAIHAEYTRQAKAVANLEGRLLRAEKQKHETAINQLKSLKDKLFPNNGLQERYDNFLAFYTRYGESFFLQLIDCLDPLEQGFVVVEDSVE